MTRSALGWLNLVLPKDRVGRVENNIAYGAHERHRLDVYCPHDDGEKRPVLMFVYGGGWRDGGRAEYEFVGRAFAAAGFVTLVPDYRLVPEIHFPDFLSDLGLALHWMRVNVGAYGGDTNRIFLMGHSAGAYNVMMLGLAGQHFGAPDLNGNLRGIVGLSGPCDFYPFDVAAAINTFSRAAEPRLTQPVALVERGAPPVMLAHGKSDVTCGLYNSENLASKIRSLDGDVVEHYYDGVGHPDTLISLFPWLRWRTPAYKQAIEFMQARL